MRELIQSLESRQLLSAALDAGVLTVTGTSKRDNIVVSLSKDGTTIDVSERSGSRFKKGKATVTSFAAGDVTKVVVDAGAGNDRVVLWGGRKNPFSVAGLINGGAGDDRLSGAAGNDTLNGGDGDDDLFGGAGDDLLNGGDGDDLVVGGKGVDTLNGDAGDDLLDATDDATTDVIDGGADSSAAGEEDNDLVRVDDGETYVNAILSTTDNTDAPGPGGHHGGGHGGHHGHGPRPPTGGTGTGSGTGGSTT
jgi:hypothetical protein